MLSSKIKSVSKVYRIHPMSAIIYLEIYFFLSVCVFLIPDLKAFHSTACTHSPIIQKMKIMASSPITAWQIGGEKMGTVTDFIFLWSKITVEGDCSHEIQRHVLLGRKGMTNLDSTLETRDITLPVKVHIVKAMVFPVVMYGCESWTIKKTEHKRIDAFELWYWKRLLRVPWTARRSNQSTLKESNPQYWLVWLTLKLQYFGHLMWRVSLEKILMLGKTKGQKRRDDRGRNGWMASLTQWTGVWASSGR